jgi:hypothetical protein
MDELIQYFSLDFLDALINEVLSSYLYTVETKRGINSMVYVIRDGENVIGSIAVKPTPANDGVYRLSYGLGTNNKLIDTAKMSAIQTNLYNRIVSEAYQFIFSEEFKDNVASARSRPSHTTPSGLIGSAISTAQWVALNMTSDTKSLDTQEILKDRDKTAEYVERMVRVEKGINAISETAVPGQPGSMKKDYSVTGEKSNKNNEDYLFKIDQTLRGAGKRTIRKRRERFVRIEKEYVGRKTQAEMAEAEEKNERQIQEDISLMKRFPNLFPKTVERYKNDG